ncbi:hypothetical protein D9757_000840 [Collybiopsis confluens]|uniref:Uncharacterized protein n=1 Tax=Collybiopsis confluens TaxID=2823264 RepID=A0A8H5I0P4_9AGAR|nr:hypothetical protein D9757_000840 [Collybiopsis confluens]
MWGLDTVTKGMSSSESKSFRFEKLRIEVPWRLFRSISTTVLPYKNRLESAVVHKIEQECTTTTDNKMETWRRRLSATEHAEEDRHVYLQEIGVDV